MRARIEIPKDKIAEFCRNNHIRRLALFGSVLRDDFTPNSDVDILVEFEVGHTPGLAFFTMQRELSKILGRSGSEHRQGFEPIFQAGSPQPVGSALCHIMTRWYVFTRCMTMRGKLWKWLKADLGWISTQTEC